MLLVEIVVSRVDVLIKTVVKLVYCLRGSEYWYAELMKRSMQYTTKPQ